MDGPSLQLYLYAVLPAPYVATRHIFSQDSDEGHQCPQPTLILTQISQNDMVPDQISPTDIVPGSIISSAVSAHCSSTVISLNQHEPQLNICNIRQRSHGLHQVASTSVIRRQGSSRIFPIDAAVPQIFPNRCRNSLKYCLPMPGLSNPAP